MALKILSHWPQAAAIALLAGTHVPDAGEVPHDDHAYLARVAPAASRTLSSLAASPQASNKAVTFNKAPDGLFYISATVNGARVRFLVDTGANLVVLTAGDAQRAGLAPKVSPASAKIDTAAGSAAMDRVKLQNVNVAGHQASNLDAAVMHSGLKVSLLGQNMLAKLGNVTISGNQITFQSP